MSDNLYLQKLEQRLLELQERISMTQEDIEGLEKQHIAEIEDFKAKIIMRKTDIAVMESLVKHLDKEIKKNE